MAGTRGVDHTQVAAPLARAQTLVTGAFVTASFIALTALGVPAVGTPVAPDQPATVVAAALPAAEPPGAPRTATSTDGTGLPPAEAQPVAPVEAPGPPVPDIPVRAASLDEHVARSEQRIIQPVRLRIPDARIDVTVGPVGVGADGQMAIPDDVYHAGWYRFGPAPGDPAGTAVLAAHVDSWTQGAGPFARLRNQVKPGMEILVTTADGQVHSYRVSDNRMIPKPQMPLDTIFDRSGAPRLVVVTCGGRFQRDVGRYTDNIVVTAVPVGA